MLSNIKRFVKKYNKQVKIALVVLLFLVIFLVLYKSLFYSSSEKSVYGVRIKDISEHKISNKEKDKWKNKALEIDGVTECKINIKGRLIKFFVTFEDNVNTDDIKTKLSDISNIVGKDVKSYYDITFYAKQNKEGKTNYPVIGYKHKTSESISFDTF